jgi:protein TonB
MASTDYGRRGPNRLLQGMILVSLGIHALVIIHITDIYKLNALQYIEFALQEDQKPIIRSIPRPLQLPKAEVRPGNPKPLQATFAQIPDVNQIKIAPGDSRFSSGLMEGVGLPTQQDYIEMVRLRIDRVKKYPNENLHGTVALSFVINRKGFVQNLKIVKPSPHKVLNDAALQAVRDSNPFPRLPPHLFKDNILIELNVNFELL